MQSPPFPRYLIPPRSKYSPQHHILKHPQLPFLPCCQRPLCLYYTALCSVFSIHDTNWKGFVPFSLRSNSLLPTSWIASTFSWWRSLSSCFLANRLIYAVTISMLRSRRRSAFPTFQGASTMFLSTLFWNLCIMAVLLGLVYPHSCMP